MAVKVRGQERQETGQGKGVLRGLILGTVSGLALSAVALSAASLLGPQPAGNAPPSPPLTAAPAVAPPDSGAEPAAVPAPGDDATSDPAASVTAPVAEVADPAAPQIDTAPALVPDAAPDVALALPETSAAPALAGGAEAPVLPNPLALAPAVPPGEADLTVSTTPATPQPPEVVVVEVPPEPAPGALVAPGVPADLTAEDVASLLSDPSLPDVPPAAAPGTGPLPDAAPAPEGTAPESGPEAPVAPATTDDAPALTDAAPRATGTPPEGSAGVEVTAEGTEAPPATDTPPEGSGEAEVTAEATEAPPATDTPPEGSAEPETLAELAEAPTAPDAAPAVSALPAGTEAVRVNRPGAEPAAEAPAPEPQVEEITGPALVQFATAFSNPLALPLLSVVLIDAGDLADAPTAVAAIPFPVTVAIDPARPGAAEAMAAYRAAGIEVAALVRLPVGAQPVDLAVVYEAAFATLPAAVAVLDIGEGGLRGDSAVLPQALDRLAADGRGLAILTEGLDTTTRRAEEAGVPAVEVFRDLDSEGQDARVIRRFLDQAAFRARQDGEVVMLARVRPDTLSALLLWGAADRAAQVALAPLSAVLMPTGAAAP